MNKDRHHRPLVLLVLSLFLFLSLPTLFATAAPIHSAERMQARPEISHTAPANAVHEGNPALNLDQPASDVTPPTSQVEPLPAYSRNDVTVRWSGSDDLSGIAYFEIQYRVGEEGDWQDWEVYGNSSANFSKQPGKTIYFRSRATDNAGLKEAWPEGNGDTFTTFYNWALRGKATDNRLVPVSGFTASSLQQPFENNPSDDQGHFSAFFDGYDAIYQIEPQRTGYGSLPQTNFSALDDATMDVLLPPADDIIVDSDFEQSPTLTNSWSAGGDLAPIMTKAQRHSGEQSAFLGSLFQLENIAQFDADPNFDSKLGPKLDDHGRFHLVWYPGGSGDNKNIYYASGDLDGVWSEPEIVNPVPTYIRTLLWDVSPDGTVHIVWDSYQETYDILYHLWKDDSGWHGPTTVYNIGYVRPYALRADSQGGGHLLWQLSGSSFDDTYYSYVDPTGTWSSPDRLFVPYDTEAYNLILDKNDVVHLQWSYSGDDLLHNYRKSDGTWSERELVAPGGYNWYNDLLIDDNNGVHLVWGNVSSGKIFHSKRQVDGSWLSSYVSDGTGAQTETIKAAAGPAGTLVLAWIGGEYSCFHPYAAYIDSGGGWTTTKKLNPGNACINDFWLARTEQQLLMYTDFRQGGLHSICLLPLGDGSTSPVGECTNVPETSYGDNMPYPMQGPDDLSHVFWRKAGNDSIIELIHSRTNINETAAVSRLYQTIDLPPTQPWPTLSFAYLQKSDALTQSGGLRVIVADTDGMVDVFSGKGTGSWQYGWVDMAPWSGSPVTVIFELEQAVGEGGTWSYVDEVHLGSAYPDSWLDIKEQNYAYPGGNLDLQIQYGNNSSVEAMGAEVVLNLPAGLTFVESSPEPTSQSGTIVWDVGTIYQSADAKTIAVKTEVSSSLTGDERLPVLAVLETPTTEPESSNNASEITIALYGEPEADFSATPVAGAPPLIVDFSNTSTGYYLKCLWEFGDNSTSDECQETSHQYESRGTYTVKLTVEGPAGKDTKTKTDYIMVYEPTTADFSITPETGAPPLSVQFTNLSTGDFDQCLWNFGDDSTSDECGDPSHTYSESGTYSVSLTVDGPGGGNTVTKADCIKVFQAPTADFSASPEAGALPLEVDFTNLSTGDFDTCSWEFGDGTTSEECGDLSHTYDESGSYAVALTVDGPGGNNSMTKPDYITVYEPPIADFSASPEIGAPPLTVDFTNLSTGDFDQCLWDFGDGRKNRTCGNLRIRFREEGHFTIGLTVEGPGGEDTKIVNECVNVAYFRLFLPGVLAAK